MSHAWYMYRSENSLWVFFSTIWVPGIEVIRIGGQCFYSQSHLNFIPLWAVLVFVICAVGDFSQAFNYLWPNHFSFVDFKSYHLTCSTTISYITIRLSTYFHFIVHTFGEVLISSILCIFVSVLVSFLLLLIWI